MELAKQDQAYLNLVLSNLQKNNNLSNLSNANKASLKEMISYLSDLKKRNIIKETFFREMVALACANYIESEVNSRLNKFLNKKVFSALQNF